MKQILHIISSPRGQESNSIKLSNAIIGKLQTQYPGAVVEKLDLSGNEAPHLNAAHINAFYTPAEYQTSEHQTAANYSDNAIAQLQASDIIVIGAPLYNFSIPSTLKAWIDQISRAGKTFRYDENGAEGLIKGKKVYLAISTGAIYSEGPWQAADLATPYLKTILSFLGMSDITVFRAEGLNIPGIKEKALETAIGNIKIQA